MRINIYVTDVYKSYLTYNVPINQKVVVGVKSKTKVDRSKFIYIPNTQIQKFITSRHLKQKVFYLYCAMYLHV